jgi:hypothetical protein
VSPTLARTLRSTNSIESMISIARNHSMNVKHWQNDNMALRWCAAGMIEAPASSAASTATSTYPHYAPRSTRTSLRKLSVLRVKMNP